MTSFSSHRFERFEVRPSQRSLLADGQAIALGARAFDMLVALIERRDRVVGTAELFELVWPGLVVEENNLRQQVAALRKVLGADAIVTVPGRGYRFAPPLVTGEARAPAMAGVTSGPEFRRPNNLPMNLPPLIGRESELRAVTALLADTHLLTLVGAGGVGKTRLALEIADTVQAGYPDGVWLVELAPIADPALVPATVASVLGVHEEPGRALADTLFDFLRRRELLLVLDNCEHLIEACARLAESVQHTSAATRILATSREALGIDGEMAWRVPSLRAAPPQPDASAAALMDYPATRLFVQRASAASPTFRLTPRNAAAVAQICHRLDGIPLALELAAARVKAMRVEQVAERLQDRFALLTRGSRTALLRHQTLRSLIDWSHDLLTPPERVLLRRLSVFAGGWTLEAAEDVCGGEGIAAADVLDLLTHLVEKSLVGLDDEAAEPRYRMLETIRQYGLEKLVAASEADALRSRHLDHFARFAESLREVLVAPDLDRRWNARADADLDNIRVALSWSLTSGATAPGLHLVVALHRFWYQNMHWKEAVGWIARLGERADCGGAPTPDRARSLYVAAMLATNFDPLAGRRLATECLEMSRALDFGEGMAWGLAWIGYIDTRRRDPATAALFTESRRIGQAIQEPWRRAMVLVQCLICFAGYEALMGHDEAAEALLHDSGPENERLGGSQLYYGHCSALLGTIATRRGEFKRAAKLLGEGLAFYRAIDSKFDIAGSLVQLGFLALLQQEPLRALALFRESLPFHRNYPLSPWVTKGLAQLLIAYAACGRWTVAARLAGALGGGQAHASIAPPELSGRAATAYIEAVSQTVSALGAAAFGREARIGSDLTREQAIELALAD